MSVKSPCIDVCEMDARSGLCKGCFRTIEEITAWSRLDEDGKRAVLLRIAEREAATDIFDEDMSESRGR